MSANLKEIFDVNPAASMASTDLEYLARSPYGNTNDMAITWANKLVSIAAQLTNLSGITGNINLNPTPATDLTASAITQTFTAAENVTFGQPCYINSSGKMAKSDSEFGGPLATHLALGTILTDASGLFASYGYIRNDAWNWTVGGLIYLSTTATLTQTKPSSASDAIQVLGMATHADRLFFSPYLFYVTPLGDSLVHATSAAAARSSLGISAGILSWVEVTGTTQAMAVNTGYIANNASLVTFTAPATWAVGDQVAVIGKGAGGWGIVFNSGQSARIGSVSSTTTTGSVVSSNRYDSVNFIGTTANTILTHLGGPQGQPNFDTL